MGALAAIVAAGVLGAGTASAEAAGAVQSTLTSFARANPGVSALVWRLDEGGPVAVARIKPDRPRIPASNMKMITAAGALLQLGPDFRFTTRVATTASARLTAGTLTGPLYLIGSGDPLLATRAYSANYLPGPRSTPMVDLARPLKQAGIRRVRGEVVADEGLFDSRRMGPTWPSYYASYSQPLSALASNQNYAGDRRGSYASQPWRSSARRLVSSLKGVGVSHRGAIRRGSTPAATRVLATATSPPLRRIVREMNVPSDNFIAEMLTKATGVYGVGQGTTSAGGRRTTELLRHQGILTPRDRLVDGSGLSRSNRLTATTLVRLVAAADADPSWGRAFISSLPKGGEGTLVNRMRSGVATNRVRAKTGYINGASSLSGRVVSRGGTHYAFSMLMNTHDITGAKATQDRVVTLLARGSEDSRR